MDANEALAQIKANSTPFRNTAIRQVQGGYVLSAQTSYVDNATKGIGFTENAEAVAADVNTAAQLSLNYHRSGNFDGTSVITAQPSLFADQQSTTQPAPTTI